MTPLNEKCRYCGSGPLNGEPAQIFFDCWMRISGQDRRTHRCLEREIINLKNLIVEMFPSLEQLRGIVQTEYHYKTPKLDELIDRVEDII